MDSREHTAEKDAGMPSVEWMLDRLANQNYDGGINGTCYECPFASVPLDRYGVPDPDVWNDPTEAYFRCSLPTRKEDERLAWGEYAPCSVPEWVATIKARVLPPAECGAQYGSNPDRCYHDVGHSGSHSNHWGTTWANVTPPAEPGDPS